MSSPATTTFCFSVHADAAEPSALPRVMEVFALFGHVPARCHVERHAASGDLVVDAQLEGLGREEAALVAKRLGRVISVVGVLWSEKLHQRQQAA